MKKPFLSLTAAALLLAPLAAQAATKICLEAETSTDIQETLKKSLPGTSTLYSGKGYIEIPWDKNVSKGQGQATLKLNQSAAGTFYIWARTYWGNGCGNSIMLVVNGQERILGEDGTYGKWHWVDSRTKVELKSGLNTIVMKNRETGVKIDQIFLTNDAEYTPTKTRAVTHDGATGNPVK